jgi:hypothetical protein
MMAGAAKGLLDCVGIPARGQSNRYDTDAAHPSACRSPPFASLSRSLPVRQRNAPPCPAVSAALCQS